MQTPIENDLMGINLIEKPIKLAFGCEILSNARSTQKYGAIGLTTLLLFFLDVVA